MTESTRTLLRRTLASSYHKLRRRLAQRLGSDGLAGDVLHETWVRLGQGGELAPITSREAYVYRVAINTATSMRIASERTSYGVELDDIHDMADEAPGPDRMLESQDQVRVVGAALAELPERQREVFVACYLHGTPTETIAERHGVSVRTIQADLRTAVVHCARRLGRKDVLADRAFRVSRN